MPFIGNFRESTIIKQRINKMKNSFFNTLFSRVEFTDSEISTIESKFTFRMFPSKTELVPFNKKTDELYFITKGCIRKYCIKDGLEITILIATEGQFAVEYVSFMTGNYSQNTLQTLEDCEVLVLKKKDLEELYHSIPKMNELMRKVLESVLIDTQTMLNEFIMYSPEERYINLLENKPQLFDRVPQFIIASYLGISATSLSRIRKRIIKK